MSTKKIQVLNGSFQSDWNETDETQINFIKNKPTEVLQYSEQSLSDDEQLQARTNIGAASGSDLDALSTLVGDKSVAEQIDEALTDIGDISITTDSELNIDSENPIQNKAVAEKFEAIEHVMNNVAYKEIGITSFTNNIGVVEKGSIVKNVTLSWATTDIPMILALDGTPLDNITSNTGDIPLNLNLTSTKTWFLKATDERGIEKIATTWIDFFNGVYYGVANSNTVFNSSTILDLVEQKQLTKSLQGSQSTTFTVTANEGQYIVYFLPAEYDAPIFTVDGLTGGFKLHSTFEFKNSSEYTETYCLWVSDNTGLGKTTVKVV